jgi:hypothetical protein
MLIAITIPGKTTPPLCDSTPTDNLQVTQDCNTNEGTILTVFSTFDWVFNAIAKRCCKQFAISIPMGKITIDKIMNNLIFMKLKTIDYSYILAKKSPVIKTRELLN